jgi:hypothetical protein
MLARQSAHPAGFTLITALITAVTWAPVRRRRDRPGGVELALPAVL